MRKLMIAGVLGALLIPIGSARADHDLNRKSPPRVRLIHQGEVVQRVSSWSYCWSYTDGEWGIGQCADGSPGFPEAAPIDGPDRVVLRIPYSAEPERVRINAYRKIRNGYFAGDSERLEYTMKPHRVKGHVSAWDAVFALDEEDRHYYLDVNVRLYQGDPAYSLHAADLAPASLATALFLRGSGRDDG